MNILLYLSASTMHSISSFDRRPLSLVIVMRFDLPVVLSDAEMWRIPLVSISKVTGYHGERARDTGEFEFAEQVVVLGAGTFIHLHEHTGLVVRIGREGFGLLGGPMVGAGTVVLRLINVDITSAVLMPRERRHRAESAPKCHRRRELPGQRQYEG